MAGKVIDLAEARARLRGGGFAGLMADAARADVPRAGSGWAPTPMTLDEIRADIEHGCEQLLKISHASSCPCHEDLDAICSCSEAARFPVGRDAQDLQCRCELESDDPDAS